VSALSGQPAHRDHRAGMALRATCATEESTCITANLHAFIGLMD